MSCKDASGDASFSEMGEGREHSRALDSDSSHKMPGAYLQGLGKGWGVRSFESKRIPKNDLLIVVVMYTIDPSVY